MAKLIHNLTQKALTLTKSQHLLLRTEVTGLSFFSQLNTTAVSNVVPSGNSHSFILKRPFLRLAINLTATFKMIQPSRTWYKLIRFSFDTSLRTKVQL